MVSSGKVPRANEALLTGVGLESGGQDRVIIGEGRTVIIPEETIWWECS